MTGLFEDIYRDKTVLITGHNGFKGSWLVQWLCQLGSRVIGCSLDDYPNKLHFDLIKDKLSYEEFNTDIRDYNALQAVVDRAKPDIVFHLAAQPLVRDSYDDPLYTFETNVAGTINVLEAIRRNGNIGQAVIITTDKVYENREWTWPYRENDRLGGHDPYSSSKACAEEIVKSYKRSFFSRDGIRIASARAGNVIGGGDWSRDRLIPDIVRAIESNGELEIRNPKSIRPWQHVLDSISGYLLLGKLLLEGNSVAEGEWNFGPALDSCISVENMLTAFGQHLSINNLLFGNHDAEKHESGMLMLDCSKAQRQLSWNPVWGLDTTIDKTANWYLEYLTNKSVRTQDDLEQYVKNARNQKTIWTL